MCGICGVIQVDGEPRAVVSPAVLDRMTDAMTHRGPNDRGTHVDDGVALGVRRLSIVDVDGGHQPFGNEDGTVWAVQNGELYNHAALREQLAREGHRFRSRCDTEILPHLYERFGPSFQTQLRGMFGLAVWDARRRRAVIARDRLGIKPLYFARSGDLLVFASELKSLLASGLVAPELDYEAIDAYLSLGFVPGPRTPLAGVSKLLPGHRLVIADRAVRIERYWAFPEPEPGDLGEDEYAERLLAELEESVRLRLMSDVPLGAMLSGGIDSSVIVALMARNMSEPVKTFSVGFREAGDENELARARAVADFFGTDHHELELSLADQDVDLAELVWHLDEPLADLSALGFLTLSELAARHVTVALSGQGADEMLGGYRKHLAASLAGRLRAVPAPLRALAPRLARLGPPDLVRAAETLTAADPASRLLAMSGQLEPELRARLVRGPLAELDGGGARRSLAARLNGTPDDPLATTLYLDAQLGLVDDMLHYFDRTSMAYSLEVRVPFLDHRFVEFAATIPNRMKVRGLTRKALLRRVARGLVPEDVVERGKVSFFRGVVDEWFRSQTEGAIADYLLGQNARSAELLDRAVVERLVRDHISGADRRHAHLLNAILMLEVWLAEYLPRALRHEPARDYVPVAAGSS